MNEQGQPNIVNAANHKRTHSPQISMSFCPEKCTCGFTNRTNRLEVKYLKKLKSPKELKESTSLYHTFFLHI